MQLLCPGMMPDFLISRSLNAAGWIEKRGVAFCE